MTEKIKNRMRKLGIKEDDPYAITPERMRIRRALDWAFEHHREEYLRISKDYPNSDKQYWSPGPEYDEHQKNREQAYGRALKFILKKAKEFDELGDH